MPQLLVALLAAAGYWLRDQPLGQLRPLWVPYYFVLANLAAALAVLSVAMGRRFEQWTPTGRDEVSVKTPLG